MSTGADSWKHCIAFPFSLLPLPSLFSSLYSQPFPGHSYGCRLAFSSPTDQSQATKWHLVHFGLKKALFMRAILVHVRKIIVINDILCRIKLQLLIVRQYSDSHMETAASIPLQDYDDVINCKLLCKCKWRSIAKWRQISMGAHHPHNFHHGCRSLKHLQSRYACFVNTFDALYDLFCVSSSLQQD